MYKHTYTVNTHTHTHIYVSERSITSGIRVMTASSSCTDVVDWLHTYTYIHSKYTHAHAHTHNTYLKGP